jgi:glycosyltransferase involved in cell wall biosynthesis
MACGCPVITCQGGSIPEVAGNDVIYVAPDNPSETLEAMLAVQTNKTRNKLIEVGLERAALFTWPKMALAVQHAAEKLTS